MFKQITSVLAATAASITLIGADINPAEARGISFHCGATSSAVAFPDESALMFHKGGSVSWRNSYGQWQSRVGRWTSANNGDVRVIWSDGETSVYPGLMNNSCDVFF